MPGGVTRVIPLAAIGRCMTRYLPFGAGCAPGGQVLLLVRLPKDGGFGSWAAMESLVESSEAVGASLNGQFELLRCK